MHISSHFFCQGAQNGIMSKSTNRVQLEMLISKMQQNQDIARVFVKEPSEKVAAFWKQLALELNSAGPPEKNETEWKKVWTDQKLYVGNKASSNKRNERGTGGGSNKTIKFSSSEESIYELVGMKEAVHGVGNRTSYGLPQSVNIAVTSKENTSLVESNIEIEEVVECSNNSEFNKDLLCASNFLPSESPCRRKSTLSVRKSDKISSNEVVLKEFELQKDLCSKVGEVTSLFKNRSKELEYSAKKMYRSLECIGEQQNLEFKEMKRHNLEIEKLRKAEVESKIERNRRMLELEEIKIQVLQNNTVRFYL